jgi:cell division septal protein FtsQ
MKQTAMTTRARDAKRDTRTPAIWRGPLKPRTEIEGPAIPHGSEGRMYVSWRLFSALIVVSLAVVLFLFFAADAFYVRSVAVGGLRYLTKEEVFALSDVANMHVFWVDPEQVRANILRSPTIADAVVHVGWPPQMVSIVIQEREPAVVWDQAGVAAWIDLQGRVMRQWEDRDDLVRVFAEMADGPISPEIRIDPQVVNGALQLHDLRPDLTTLRYHPIHGLGFSDERGWDAWFGTGTDMPERILIYNAIVENLTSRGIQPSEINVVNPDKPFYCSLISGCPGGV